MNLMMNGQDLYLPYINGMHFNPAAHNVPNKFRRGICLNGIWISMGGTKEE